MRHDVRRAALRAAAKLALTATVLGCGAAETSGNDPGDQTDQAVRGGASRHHHDAAAAPAACADKASCPTEQAACCSALVADELKTIDASSFIQASSLSSEATACCHLLSQHYDDELKSDAGMSAWSWGSDSKIKMACCEDIQWAGTTCTPWGPPVPPAMKKRAKRTRRAAMLEVA